MKHIGPNSRKLTEMIHLSSQSINGSRNKRIMLLRAVIIGRQLLYALDHAYLALITRSVD